MDKEIPVLPHASLVLKGHLDHVERIENARADTILEFIQMRTVDDDIAGQLVGPADFPISDRLWAKLWAMGITTPNGCKVAKFSPLYGHSIPRVVKEWILAIVSAQRKYIVLTVEDAISRSIYPIPLPKIKNMQKEVKEWVSKAGYVVLGGHDGDVYVEYCLYANDTAKRMIEVS